MRKCPCCGKQLGIWDAISGKAKHPACAANEEQHARELAQQREQERIEAERQEGEKRRAAEEEAYRQHHGLASIVGQENAVQALKSFATIYAHPGPCASSSDENAPAKSRLKIRVFSVNGEPVGSDGDRRSGHVLLTGSEGIGRGTLARAFAVEYCGRIVEADMKTLNNTGDLMGPLTNLGEGDAFIVRHLERTPSGLAGLFVHALRDLSVDFVVDKGMLAKTITVPLKGFTCIGTANSESQCQREVAEAFHLALPLEMYSREELALICRRLAEQRGLSMSPIASEMVARACDGTPHNVDLLVSRLAASGVSEMDEEEAAHVLSVLGLRAHTAKAQAHVGDLQDLSGIDFEKLIAELLRNMGFRAQMTKASGDGGIDIVATLDRPIVGGRYLIQCKRFAPNNLVGSATVREFYGALTADYGAMKGIFITTSDFTAQARDFAEGLPVELIAGPQLLRLLSDHGIVKEESKHQDEARSSDEST